MELKKIVKKLFFSRLTKRKLIWFKIYYLIIKRMVKINHFTTAFVLYNESCNSPMQNLINNLDRIFIKDDTSLRQD
jgi:hypothetical protein